MAAKNRLILTPQAEDQLILREVADALRRSGCTMESREQEALRAVNLARMLALPPERSSLKKYPDLFFSVNFNGLDKFGENFALLHDKGIPVAVWCVNNPWNLLSGLRTDFWKNIHLFVTDQSFVPGLKAHGAQRVFFLPLATDPDIFPRASRFRIKRTMIPRLFLWGVPPFPTRNVFLSAKACPRIF